MTRRRPFDPTLYLIAGTDAVGGRDLLDLVSAAVAGGVTCVQLREKSLAEAQVVRLARALKARLAPLDVPLIINDSLTVALAAEADGLHLGQDDLPAREARAALGPERILGLSAGNLAEARRVDTALVDYVGVGPVFPTGTKADAGAAIGLEGVAALRAYFDLPLVAIGGIQEAKAADVTRCGVDGLAVVSAICGAQDPQAAARGLRQAIDRARVTAARARTG
jgi:thiamine-phosphate pyrophosphorylase